MTSKEAVDYILLNTPYKSKYKISKFIGCQVTQLTKFEKGKTMSEDLAYKVFIKFGIVVTDCFYY